ncbi:MAG: 16S rRNA (adenine(1518)-N(6)/adenine(1519)-N(6))-dimethyltransferase RsmA [Defluviitaleaceae bacterium]|nr:16S rRNA (adenine(1518)-N(6)/adenine(1519)-N(6))-dimethyltransferase RsmA [Defluviitaleaceae bacterium]
MVIDRIASRNYTAGVVNRFDFRIKKGYGQNFLVDQHVLGKIIRAADIKNDELVIEIGPGIGALTQELAERAEIVAAVEIDKALIPVLSETLSGYDNVEIINADILKTDVREIISKYNKKSAKVIANLPYYITTPIVMSLLELGECINSIVVMVQKEVALRMAAKPGTKDYGSLSLAVQFYSETSLVANVPTNCFYPRPGVDSAVIKLDVLSSPPVDVKDSELMFQIIRAAFSKRRKTLVNCLESSESMSAVFGSLSKADIEEILVSCDLPPKVRGESLGLEEFARLANLIEE